MFVARFEEPTLIISQPQFERLFRTDRVRFQAGARLVCQGEISIDSEVTFEGNCDLAGPLTLHTGSILNNVRLGLETTVRAYSMLSDLAAGTHNLFGPFCFIRDNCSVGDDCILGAHVETARSCFADGVRISHRAFVGDASIGERTIVGAGVVFCNFDGQSRQPTQVGADVTIGSGTLIVPPVTIGRGAIIAAGSVVTKDIAEGVKLIQKRHPQS